MVGAPDVALYHVVGRRDSAWAAGAVPAPVPGGLHYVQVPYEERMALFYQAADVVVARAGANTVAELSVVGCPPCCAAPPRPGDHQRPTPAVLERPAAPWWSPTPSARRPAWREIDALLAAPAPARGHGRAAARWGDRGPCRGGRAGPAHARARRTGGPVSAGGAGDGARTVDLSVRRRVHVVGAGGAGMSAIASVLAAMGHMVTGSDLKDVPRHSSAWPPAG